MIPESQTELRINHVTPARVEKACHPHGLLDCITSWLNFTLNKRVVCPGLHVYNVQNCLQVTSV